MFTVIYSEYLDIEVDAHARKRCENVGEEDASINAIRPAMLQSTK